MTKKDRILAFLSEGHSIKETAELADVSYYNVVYYRCRAAGYVDPRKKIRQTAIQVANKKRLSKARKTPDRIFLTQNKIALIDPEDFELLIPYKWNAHREGRNFYAIAAGNRKMHRIILDAPSNFEVDHINGDGLDNRKQNLRLATRTQNARNIRKTGHRSKYKGVWPNGSKWAAMIGNYPNRQYLGQFSSQEKAALAYDVAALEHYGEFARLNFPDVPKPREAHR